MQNRCYQSQGVSVCNGLELHRIWQVRADSSYDVPRTPCQSRALVAVRTRAGAGQLRLADGWVRTLTPETMVLLELGRVAHYRTVDQRWAFWWFELNFTGPPQIPLGRVLAAPAETDETRRCRQCADLLERDDVAHRAWAGAILTELLYRWSASWRQQRRDVPPQRRIIQQTIARMRRDLSQPENIAALAERVGISDRHLRSLFRRETGLSPKQYYDRLRMETAVELLRTQGLNVSQVADQLGFSSPYHFSRAFTRHHGRPPSSFRGG